MNNLFCAFLAGAFSCSLVSTAYAQQAVSVDQFTGTANVTIPLTAASIDGAAIPITQKRVLLSDGSFGQWLRTALFYDKYGNPIQKQSAGIIHDLASTELPNVTTIVYRQHGFVRQIRQVITAQKSALYGETLIRNRFAYDPGGRVESIWQQNEHDGEVEPEVLMARYAYNALGQLVEKNLHSRDRGLSFLQSVDLRYNIHGELTSFNNSALQTGTNNDDSNDLFGFSLNRETADQTLGATARFDGGITSVRWRAHNPVQHNQPERERSYVFGYDELARLTSANFSAQSTAAGFVEERGAYDENIQYGPNGNIASLTRKSQANTATSSQYDLDNLAYSYGPDGGNQLRAVDDSGNPHKGFRDAVSGPDEYDYDANGNLIRDQTKGLSLEYNVLNKVAIQVTDDGGKILSDFDADGNLVHRSIYTGSGDKFEYAYVDGYVYEESKRLSGIAAFPTPEGRVVAVTTGAPPAYDLQPAAGPTIPPAPIPAPPATPAPTVYGVPPRLVYEYHLRDHQGNLRLAFRAEQAPRWLHLAMDNPATEEGTYPKFENVTPTLKLSTPSLPAQQGPSYAAVTNTRPGPANSLPVSQGDVVKVSFYYRTPAGVQSFRPAARAQSNAPTTPVLQVAPLLISALGTPTTASPAELQKAQPRPFQWLAGVQFTLTGLLRSCLR